VNHIRNPRGIPRFSRITECSNVQRARGQKVDGGAAEARGGVDIGGALINLARTRDLHQPPGGGHPNAVGQRRGLKLVVRDIDDGGAKLALDAFQLDAQIPAQLGVERGERFIR